MRQLKKVPVTHEAESQPQPCNEGRGACVTWGLVPPGPGSGGAPKDSVITEDLPQAVTREVGEGRGKATC